ncbi:MAG: hypothetical protein KGL46_09955 [Hyphomicrobiales bacterium]|nr:hypothetical protein [Hyphomicrobiales bacterium]
MRPSLGVSDGRNGLLFHCFAGCKPLDIIAALNRLNLDTRDSPSPATRPTSPKTPGKTTTALARRLWASGEKTVGTPAETYLRARRFTEQPPPTIRFLRSYRYDRASGLRLPCLMAAVQSPTREIVAVQLTFLDPSGRRKADVPYPRRAVGPLGEGLLRTAPAAPHIGIAEGFETAWAASLMHDRLPVWATLGRDRFPVIVLPEIVRRVTVFADHDAPGLASSLAYFEQHSELEIDLCFPATPGFDFARLWEDAHTSEPAASLTPA